MRRPVQIPTNPARFNFAAWVLALLFHLFAVSLVWSATPGPIAAKPQTDISVVLVAPALPRTWEPAIVPQPLPSKPKPDPKPKTSPKPKPTPAPDPVPQPTTPSQPEISQGSPSIIQQESIAEQGEAGFPDNTPMAEPHIPSRWALKPPLAPKRLEGLGFSQRDIVCLTSLKPECQDLRKEVFAEYQLTETELVWTPNRPDTGMPAEFRGLSDNEILEKLGMNYAGGNALVILPGISIDGPLWDKLHGVNKTCKLRQNYGNVLDGTAGTLAPQRVCD